MKKSKNLIIALCLIAGSLPSLAREAPVEKKEISEQASYQAYHHFVNGDLLELAGNPQAAAEEYQKALQLNPSLHEARFQLAQILYRLRDLDGSLEQAQLLPEDKTEYLQLKGMLSLSKKDYSQARQYYLKALELDSADVNTLYALVQLYHRENQVDTAALFLEKMIILTPPNSQSHQQIAEYYFKLGKSEKAISEYNHALELDSANSQALAGLALVYENQRDFRRALDTYLRLQALPTSNLMLSQKIIGLYYNLNLPDSAISMAQSALASFPDDIPLKKILGSLYFSQEDYSRAESVFVTITEKDPQDLDAVIYLGRIALAKKDYSLAETHFQQAINFNDTLLEAWFGLANVYLEQKKFGQAEETFLKSLEKTADSVNVYIAMGLGYGRAKQFSQAQKYFEQALKIKPENPGVILALGNLHQQQGKTQTAEDYFLQVLQFEPDNATALNNLGYLWAEQGTNLDKSLEMIGRALQQEPNNPAFLDSYGWNLYKMGRLQEAEEYLTKAKDLLSTDPEVHIHLGELYQKLGKTKMAQECWKKALELDPENQKLKEKLSSSTK